MINPYYIYSSAFLFSLLIYGLGWSDLFPSLRWNVILFLSITVIISAIFGSAFQKRRIDPTKSQINTSRISKIVGFILVLWILEFIYNKGIPLILILRGVEFDYMKFGIPTFHVFVVTFTSFFTVFTFHIYLSSKKKKVLFYYSVLMIMPLLLFNRGMLLINLVSSAFVYLQFVKSISARKIFILAMSSIVVLYLFGVLGDIRSVKANRPGEEVSSQYILDLGGASKKFVNGTVPSEFFWTYLYVASPIGNLQYNIDVNNQRTLSARNFLLFVNNEFLFDFISKRINSFFKEERESCLQFIPSMSVATAYTNSFIYFGWTGLILMGLFVISFPIFYLGIIRKSNTFYVTATSIMCSLYLFLIFDNMFAFTGLSFQLIYPIIFNRLYSLKFKF